MVKRSINFKRHLVVAALTICIFLLGLFLGFIIEGKRVMYVQDLNAEQKIEYSSMQLQFAYIDQISKENNCPGVLKTFNNNVMNLESARLRLEEYIKSAKIDNKEFSLLKREYILAQIRYWMLAKKTKEMCDNDIVTLLYFPKLKYYS